MRRKIRSGFLALAMPVFLSVFSGCTDMVREELDETHAKLRALQELAGSVNRDLTTLDLIVKELDDSHTILPESFQETEEGYEVSFRDGKQIFIPFGKDGVTFIPVGVQDDADGLYYWKVDGEWLLDAEGNKIRAGSTDGIVPQFEVRDDGYWWMSVDGGKTFERFASCEEMNGLGVFRDVRQTTLGKVILTLWDGDILELVSEFPFRLSFDGPVRDTVLIAAGELLPIPYQVILEGETDQPVVVTSGTDGTYLSSLEAADGTSGVVKVQAPADFKEGYILLSASCGGYSTVKLIAFKQRTITPADAFTTIRFGSGEESRAIPFEANFEYVVSGVPETWLEAVPDPETGILTFTVRPNAETAVRAGEVTVSPQDNPDFVCATFRILQATDSYTIQLEEGGAFTFDPEQKTLYAPAAGGKADLWLTFRTTLSVSITGTADWIQAGMADEDGFRRMRVHVDPTTDTADREVVVLFRAGAVPVGEIKVIQAGASAGI